MENYPQKIEPFFEHEKGVLYKGDNQVVLKQFADNTFDTVVTDPQYAWKFMGKKWDYELPTVEQCAEILRVTKPGGYLFANIGNRTSHRITCAFEDAGWIIQPFNIWLFAGTMPKGTDVSKQIDKVKGLERKKVKKKIYGDGTEAKGYNRKRHKGYQRPWMDLSEEEQGTLWETEPASFEAKLFEGYKTGIKTAFELILCAMKPPEGTFAQNALKWGVAGFNIEECRLPLSDGAILKRPPKGTDGRCYGHFKGENVESTPDNKGRYPSNVYMDEETAELLDGVSGVTKDRDRVIETSGKGHSVFFGPKAHKSKAYSGEGGASRFFWVAKAPQSQRHKGLPDDERNEHPTVKPLDLICRLIRLTKTPTGGKILDPWAGSGTTLVAAVQEGRHFTGIEQDEVSCEIAKKRVIEEIGSMFI